MVRAGELTTVAAFERSTSPSDSFADERKQWNPTIRAMVKITPASGGESVVGKQVTAINSHKVEMHYHPNVRPRDRFKISRYTGDPLYVQGDSATHYRIFHIESILNSNEFNRSLELMCKEMV